MSAKNVKAQVVGGSARTFDDCFSVGDVREKLALGSEYSGAINGVNQDDDTQLRDNDYVSFAQQVKGA